MIRNYYLTNEHLECKGHDQEGLRPEFWCANKAGRKGIPNR